MPRGPAMTATTTTAPAPRPPAVAPRPGPLGRLADLAYRHRLLTVVAWLGALGVAMVLAVGVGGEFKADYSAPGSDSSAAQTLLESEFPAQSGDSVDVVVHTDGPATAAAVRTDVRSLLTRLADVPHVVGIDDPYTTPGGIAPDGRTVVPHARLDIVTPPDTPVSDSQQMLDLADQASRPGLQVSLGGQTIQQAEQGNIGSEGLGLTAAALILLLTFGSVVAAGLPILVAIAGLAVSSALTTVLISVVDAPDWSTSLATMTCIGIGIDYVLLMVTRFREWRAVGLDEHRAVVATLDTAGRAVMVAGSTVVISMLGLFAMGLSFMRGASQVTILAVLIVMLASVTLFPALLAYLGRHIDRLRLPLRSRGGTRVATGGHVEPSRGWLAWSRLVERHRVVAALSGLAVLLVLATPFLGVRFGFPDAGNDRASTSTRQAYDLQAQAFGAGSHGPLLMVAELPAAGDRVAVEGTARALRTAPGVAAVTAPALSPDGTTAV